MKTPLILVAVFLRLVATAAAEPPPERSPPRPRPPACTAKGSPIVELDLRDDTEKSPQQVIKLYVNGTLTGVTTTDGTTAPPTVSCLDDNTMKTIRADLKAARWKVTRARITCRGYSPKSTIVKISGRKVLTERTCGSESLDDTSAKKLEEIEGLLLVVRHECIENPLAAGCS